MPSRPANILLTGRPGVGKTTVIMRLVEDLANRNVAGFYTEEIRDGDRRQGFRAVTFSGGAATLAHVGFPSRSRVGRYGVDVIGFEKLVLPELTGGECDLIIIDEIGKMECFSPRFIAAVRTLLDGPTPLVATVALKGAGFIAQVKSRSDVEIQEVTNPNRNELPKRLAAQLRQSRPRAR